METRKGSPVSSGIIYLVGAGPGDPDLITVRGLACVREADVILHDRLVSRRILDEARSGAEIIDVGKEHGDENPQQERIHALMIDRARRGRSVCRLKGGDPFVFGRGGEEIQALRRAGIPYIAVPGVSSAFAAPAAAAIPITHRDISHSFMVIAGNRSVDLNSAEWTAARSVVQAGGTLVVVMGLARLPLIVRSLLDSGCAGSLPVAIISKATMTDQKTRIGTLEKIRTLTEGLESPATIVIGRVVSLGREFVELTTRTFG
jgi:uroporphyrin-III C-methyltransferase